jgi:putative flavoprotein involved in K+ transport
VWHDAKHIADHIVKQHSYYNYRDADQRQADAARAPQKASLMGVR